MSPDAFATFYRTYKPAVMRVIRLIVGHSNDIEDLAQDAFLRAWSHLDQYEERDCFYHWIHRIAANVAADYLRKRDPLREGGDSLDALEEFLRQMRDAEDVAITRIELDRLLQSLAPGQRRRLQLYDLLGFTHGEIGRITGTTEDTARHHHRQALLRARRLAA